jgi:prophage DNA circulation protein
MANTAALERLINQTAVAYVAAPLAVVPLASYAELSMLRANVLELFDYVAEAAPQVVSRPLALFRASVIRQLMRRGASLLPLREYSTARPTASRVLAQRLYQDPERAAELVARTHAPHPGFLPLTGVVAAT